MRSSLQGGGWFANQGALTASPVRELRSCISAFVGILSRFGVKSTVSYRELNRRRWIDPRISNIFLTISTNVTKAFLWLWKFVAFVITAAGLDGLHEATTMSFDLGTGVEFHRYV